MSSASNLTSLTYDAAFWADLEVTGELINGKWTDDEKRGEARDRASTQSVSKDALKIAWKQVKGQATRDQVHRSKTDTFDLIEGLNSEVLKCLFAAHEFTRGVKRKYVSYYYNQISSQVDQEYRDLYDSLDTGGRRVGKTMFLYLYEPDALKSIFSLAHIDQPKPKAIGESGSTTSNPRSDIDSGDLEAIAQSDTREAVKWHDFEYEGGDYITIKRHYRDAVDTQTQTNEEVEQAEYVVARFYDDKVDVYTQKKTTASSIRDQLGSAFQSQSVDFDSAEERKPHDHFNSISPVSVIQDIDNLNDHTVMGVVATDSGLSNGPSVKLRTDGDEILPAVRDVRDADAEFITDMTDVGQIVVNKAGKTYTLFPKQEGGGDHQWYVRYQASGLTDDQRTEFEEDIEGILDIRPFYITSN